MTLWSAAALGMISPPKSLSSAATQVERKLRNACVLVWGCCETVTCILGVGGLNFDQQARRRPSHCPLQAVTVTVTRPSCTALVQTGMPGRGILVLCTHQVGGGVPVACDLRGGAVSRLFASLGGCVLTTRPPEAHKVIVLGSHQVT